MRRITALLVAIALLAIPASARADSTTLEDPDDVSHNWDIQTLSHGHDGVHRTESSEYRLDFYEPFYDDYGPGGTEGWHLVIRIFFTRDATRPNRRVVVMWEGHPEVERPLHGYIYNRRGTFLGYAKVSYGTGNLRVAVPNRLFPATVNRHWAQAVSRTYEVDWTAKLKGYLR